MSKLFPEQPILFYPSLACRFGTEEAILLSVYYQFACHHGVLNTHGQAQFILRRREWQALSPFFDEDKLALLTNSLVDQGVLEAQFQANGSIRVTVLEVDADAAVAVSAPSAEPMRKPQEAALIQSEYYSDARCPSREADSSRSSASISEPTSVHAGPSMMIRGPAPSFGGSTGWAKPKDDLELLFERQEQHHQQLKEITPNWQPQPDTLQLLAKKSITDEFSLACADQFVAYYMGQGQRKKSWEQPFMKWVMREWVGAQKKQYREQATKDQQGYSGERDQTRARQDKRERITSSVMDINNTDW